MVRARHDPEVKREQFIATALELFARKGVGNTSLRDVIKAMNGGAGTSPSVFYYYFASKGDLFEACFSTYMGFADQDTLPGVSSIVAKTQQIRSLSIVFSALFFLLALLTMPYFFSFYAEYHG